MGDIGRRHRHRRIRSAAGRDLVFRLDAVPDLCGHAARRRAQRHDKPARPCRQNFRIGCGLPPSVCCCCIVAQRRDFPRRLHHCPASHGAEQHDQIAGGQRQGVPREIRRRYQLSRYRQSDRTARRPGATARSARAGDAAQSAQRRHHCIERRRHPQPDLEDRARHRRRGRQLLHSAVPRPLLCRAAQRLSQWPDLHGAGAASRPMWPPWSTVSARRWNAG